MNSIYNAFELAYMAASVWSSCDDQDDPFDDEKYAEYDFSRNALAKIEKDCTAFLAEAKAFVPPELAEQAGHDFWLTRNGHGAGFWDRPELYGDKEAHILTNIAKKYGECHLWADDTKQTIEME